MYQDLTLNLCLIFWKFKKKNRIIILVSALVSQHAQPVLLKEYAFIFQRLNAI